AAIGSTSLLDFRRLAAVVAGMEDGVYLNIGSAVILPEVFLKTVSLGRNLGHKLSHITTVNMDFLAHYRPLTNVVRRPTKNGGRGLLLAAHNKFFLPLLVAAAAKDWGEGSKGLTPYHPPPLSPGTHRNRGRPQYKIFPWSAPADPTRLEQAADIFSRHVRE